MVRIHFIIALVSGATCTARARPWSGPDTPLLVASSHLWAHPPCHKALTRPPPSPQESLQMPPASPTGPHPCLRPTSPPPQAITSSRQSAQGAISEYPPGPGCFPHIFSEPQQPHVPGRKQRLRSSDSPALGRLGLWSRNNERPLERRTVRGGQAWGRLLPYPTSSAAGWGCGHCARCGTQPAGSTQTSGQGSCGSDPSSARSASRLSTHYSRLPGSTGHPHLGVSTPHPNRFCREATGPDWVGGQGCLVS